MARFEDTVESGAMRMTSDGYLVGEVRCARTGIQQYMASDVGIPGNGIVNVYRPEKTVFSKDSMATFVGKPITLRHPPVAVTAENWKQYAIGDIGEEIARDGEFIRVPIKIMDSDAIRDIQAGVSEISMGYTCDVEVASGVTPEGEHYDAIQTGHIKINHLAAVERARGGSELRIGDSWGAEPINDNEPPTGTPPKSQKGGHMTTKTVVLGDRAVQVLAEDAAEVEAFKTATAKAIADAQSTHDAAIAAKDAELAKLQAKLDDATGKILSDADLDAKVAARAELVSVAKAIAPDVKTEGVKDADIRKAVVTAKLGDAAIADKSAAYIDARFDILAEDAKPTDPVAGAFRQGIKTDDAAINDAHNSYVARLTRKTKEA